MSIEIGNVYSRLTVLSKAEDRISPTSGKARFYWVCKCSCDRNKIIEVRSDGLTSGKSRSCGCLRDEAAAVSRKNLKPYKQKPLKPLPSKNYGILEVIQQGESTLTPKGRKLHRWTCKCACGNIKDILHEELIKGLVVSCGCLSRKYFGLGCLSANDEFLYKANIVHDSKYDYSITNYVHSQQNVQMICRMHGVFEQQPSNHLMGTGCRDCAFEGRATGLEEFVKRSVELHGDFYDYSKVIYTNNSTPVIIGCPKHGDFSQQAAGHSVRGDRCPECSREGRYITQEEFIKRAKEVHGDRYDYSQSVYEHTNKKVLILCGRHGPFQQKAGAHLLGQKCKQCAGEDRAEKQHWNYIKRCELNPELAESEGTLYLLEMSHEDETFLKIGISSDFTKRVGRYREERISFDVLSEVKSTAIQTAIWERDILKDIREQGFKYIPEVSFKGWTECAAIESKDYILDLFNNIQ